MLVLSRKVNESIMVGDNVELVVVSIHGDQVKLGINAPRNITVHRKEVYDEIQAENILAAKTGTALPGQIKSLDSISSLFKKKKSKKND